VLIVIDEAHSICPPDPVTPVEQVLTERVVQIAAEGRKYGLWLLLSTQRPTKIHPNALTQCDNLGLMRMSSPRDLAELSGLFGYAPPECWPRRRTSFRGRHSSRTVSSRNRRWCRSRRGSRPRADRT
jgi:DNA helicase HerA-like ATPase